MTFACNYCYFGRTAKSDRPLRNCDRAHFCFGMVEEEEERQPYSLRSRWRGLGSLGSLGSLGASMYPKVSPPHTKKKPSLLACQPHGQSSTPRCRNDCDGVIGRTPIRPARSSSQNSRQSQASQDGQEGGLATRDWDCYDVRRNTSADNVTSDYVCIVVLLLTIRLRAWRAWRTQ